ncbi:MAG TPA: hypothetical protein VF914_03825 [Chloroflexia bacterium]
MRLARWNKLAAACSLAGLCLALAACDRVGELADEGPNAKLSNDELVAAAVENMGQIESYQVVFRGGLPDDSIKMSQSLAITAEIQPAPGGSRVKIRDEAEHGPGGGPNPSLDLRVERQVDVLYTENESYHSYDGGKTWRTWGVDTPEGYLIAMFVPVWKVYEGPTGLSSMGKQLVEGLTFKDATPRLEVVDGVITRHMVAERENPISQAMVGLLPLPAGTIHLWVSTDSPPTIRQMRMEGTATRQDQDEQPTGTPFTLLWKWNRFNEDFGKVEPPPPGTIEEQ